MHRISKSFTALRSLGVFGVILVLSVAIIGWSAFNIMRLDRTINRIYQETEKRIVVEDIRVYLFEQELADKYFFLGEDKEELDWDSPVGEIDDLMTGFLDYPTSDSEVTAIHELQRGQEENRQRLEEIVAAADADDWDRVDDLYEEADWGTERMHKHVEDLTFEIETALEKGTQRANLQGRRTVVIGVMSLIIFPLLAVWAFVVASRLTQPVLTLTNAVVAIEGSQFRSDLLDDVIDRRDGLGRLAKALEQMAQGIKSREENLEQEMGNLREQLYEGRRRRLLSTSPGRRSTFER